MKKTLNLSLVLVALALVSCGTSKSTTKRPTDLKGKVASVRVTRTNVDGVHNNDEQREAFITLISPLSPLSLIADVIETDIYLSNIGLEDPDSVLRSYDKNRNLLSSATYSCDDYLITNNTWQNGLLVEEVKQKYTKYNDKKTVDKYKYEYDGNELKKCIRTSDDEENSSGLVEYINNKDGVAACELSYNNNGDLRSICVNTIESGKIIKSKSQALDGSSTYVDDRTYMGDKLVDEKIINEASWELYGQIYKSHMESYYKYDYKDDNVISIEGYMKDIYSTYIESTKDDLNTVFDYEKFKNVFDEEIKKLSVDEVIIDEVKEENKEESEEKPVKKSKKSLSDPAEVKINYEYNKWNDIVKIIYYDDWVDTKEFVYDIAYEYDKHNNWTKMTISWEDKPLFVKERVIKYY